MINYPVKVVKEHVFDYDEGGYEIEDNDMFLVKDAADIELAECVDEKDANIIANALNAMNEFPKAGGASRWFYVGLNNWFHKFFPGYEPTHEEAIEYLKSIGRVCLCSDCADT
jgi:hypothetical protein